MPPRLSETKAEAGGSRATNLPAAPERSAPVRVRFSVEPRWRTPPSLAIAAVKNSRNPLDGRRPERRRSPPEPAPWAAHSYPVALTGRPKPEPSPGEHRGLGLPRTAPYRGAHFYNPERPALGTQRSHAGRGLRGGASVHSTRIWSVTLRPRPESDRPSAQTSWRGLVVAPEQRCSPYDAGRLPVPAVGGGFGSSPNYEKVGRDAAQWLPAQNRCWFAARVIVVRQPSSVWISRRVCRKKVRGSRVPDLGGQARANRG